MSDFFLNHYRENNEYTSKGKLVCCILSSKTPNSWSLVMYGQSKVLLVRVPLTPQFCITVSSFSHSSLKSVLLNNLRVKLHLHALTFHYLIEKKMIEHYS